jgi:hypothetical protein
MGKKFVIVLFVATLFWLSTRTFGEVMRFDLGRQGDTPAEGYVHVDSTTTYGYDPNTGWTYGVFGTVISEDYWGSWQTRNTPDELTINGLRFDDDSGNFLSGFEVELPNGEYLVTVGAGKIGWNTVGKIWAEGLFYSGTVNSDNLYVLDVNPDKLPPDHPTNPNDSDGILTWTLSQDYEMHAPMYYGQIRTWGYNNNTDPNQDYFSAAECLYLKMQPVTVADGKLTVYGMNDGNQGHNLLNFVEVAPNTCQGVIDSGYRLKGDVTGDCKVSVMDFAEVADQWLTCNDPNDQNCIVTW